MGNGKLAEKRLCCAPLDTLEMAFMMQFWYTILENFHTTSQQLQRHDIDTVVVQQDGLEAFERAGINVSAISKGFKCDLQCAKKHKTVQTKVQNQIYNAMEGMTLNVTDKFTICIIYARSFMEDVPLACSK